MAATKISDLTVNPGIVGTQLMPLAATAVDTYRSTVTTFITFVAANITLLIAKLSFTALGDIVYGGASGVGTRLAGNITTTKKFLSQTGDGALSVAPIWDTVTKTDVGLSAVENTAISTWAGSSTIVTLGTVTTGVWNGTVIAPAKGGTGITNDAASTLTITGSFAITFTVGATTSLTLPASGTLATLAGTETLSSKTLTKPRMDAWYGTPATATDGATVTFDLATANKQEVTLGGNRTLALSNDTVGQAFSLLLRQDGTGSRTVTWFANIKWSGGSVPTLTTTANKADLFSFIKWGASEYLGMQVLNF